jgi:hypothetical protein
MDSYSIRTDDPNTQYVQILNLQMPTKETEMPQSKLQRSVYLNLTDHASWFHTSIYYRIDSVVTKCSNKFVHFKKYLFLNCRSPPLVSMAPSLLLLLHLLGLHLGYNFQTFTPDHPIDIMELLMNRSKQHDWTIYLHKRYKYISNISPQEIQIYIQW